VTPRLPLSYALAVAWTLGAATFLGWLVHASVALRPSSGGDVVQLGAVEALVFVLAVLGVLALHGTDAPLTRSLGMRPAHPALVVMGLVLGLVAHFPAESVDALVQRLSPESPEDLAFEATLLSASTPLRLVVVLFVVACVGPLVEELFFRGALFGVLRRDHPLFGAAAVTALCFVVGHLNHRKWPALAVVAIVMTHLRAVSGSLLPCLAMHVAFNAVTVLAFFTGEVSPGAPPKIDLLPTIIGSVATLAVMIGVQYVASRTEESRRGRAEDAE
jgi:uncharacterized protein